MAAPAAAPRTSEASAPSLTAEAIAARIGGELIGDGAATVTGVAPLSRAVAGDLSILAADSYLGQFAATGASVVLVTAALRDAPGSVAARVVVANPMDALVPLLKALYRPPVRPDGIHETAIIGRGTTIGADVAIGPYVVIGAGAVIGDRAWLDAGCVVGAGVKIGADTRVHSAVTLLEGTELGDRVVIKAGAQIGNDGYGFLFRDGAHQRIPHVGRCIIEDDVEIGANCTIDRGSIDDTVIGAGTKMDNLVHIAHNCRVGRLCLIMAHVGVAGSATIGDGAVLAGQSGVGAHRTIGKGARLGAQSGAIRGIPDGETWSGYPARPHRETLHAQAALFKLAGMMKQLEKLIARPERE